MKKNQNTYIQSGQVTIQISIQLYNHIYKVSICTKQKSSFTSIYTSIQYKQVNIQNIQVCTNLKNIEITAMCSISKHQSPKTAPFCCYGKVISKN